MNKRKQRALRGAFVSPRMINDQRVSVARQALSSLIAASAKLGDGGNYQFPSPDKLADLAVQYADELMGRLYMSQAAVEAEEQPETVFHTDGRLVCNVSGPESAEAKG